MTTYYDESAKRQFFLLKFKVMLLESDGNAFEQFVRKLFRKYDPDIRFTKPQGSKGDGGNDMFKPLSGEYYQVYGPEFLSGTSIKKAAEKIIDDFDKIYRNWNMHYPIKSYYFVYNDKKKGVYPDIYIALKKIKSKYNIQCDIIDSMKLEEIFDTLSEKDKEDLVGVLLLNDDIIKELNFEALSIVIKYMICEDIVQQPLDKLKAIDFNEKIKINGLSEEISRNLNYASYYIYSLEEYFNSFSSYDIRSRIGYILNGYYQESKEIIPDNEYDCGNLRFQYIFDKCYPKEEKSKAVKDALYIVLSYYFEACSIMESKDEGGSYYAFS